MEALKISRKDYQEGLEQVSNFDGVYLDAFEVKFPEGMNTANALQICRTIQSPDLDSKIRLMRICIAGRNVEVKCPNGDIEKFCMSEVDDSLEGFPLFQKEPLALLAIADAIYGYILKKYVRLSKPKAAAAAQKTE